MKSSYPSNLTPEQWELLQSLIPVAKPGGRPRSIDMQSVINAILYILCAGCDWRMLPSDFPNWKTVYHSFALGALMALGSASTTNSVTGWVGVKPEKCPRVQSFSTVNR